MSAFDAAFTQLVGLEGKYSDDQSDPGNWTGGKAGAGQLNGTMYGISAASYPALDIKGLNLVKAKAIYLRDFWDKCRCDTLPDAIAVPLFKQAVNMGVSGAVKCLQRSLKLTVDGEIGQITIGTATAHPPRDVLCGFLTECACSYVHMSNFDVYGKGWISRVIQVAIDADLVA